MSPSATPAAAGSTSPAPAAPVPLFELATQWQLIRNDVEAAVKKLGREGEKTNFSIFVLHNKDKPKKGALPQEILKGRYSAARTVGDVWICYPWEATYVLLLSLSLSPRSFIFGY